MRCSPQRLIGAALVAAAALAGCQMAAIEPQPLRGPAPRSVAVWPSPLAEPGPSEPDLLTGADLALRGRGYGGPALAVGRQLLTEAGLLPAAGVSEALQRVGITLDVDAILCVEVRTFAATAAPFSAARWHLAWRLLSTRGHGILWEHEHHGAWQRADLDGASALRALDAEPDYVPFGGDRGRNFRDVAELAQSLHRMAMAHLPAALR